MNKALGSYFGLRREALARKHRLELIRERIKYIFEDPRGFAETVLDTHDDNAYVKSLECLAHPNARLEERWREYRSQPIRCGLSAGGRIEH